MEDLIPILKSILFLVQLVAALAGCFYFFKLKTSYWKWFGVYLVILFIQQHLLKYVFPNMVASKNVYYLLFGIPLEYIFLYWLYAKQSLKKEKLFYIFSILYIVTVLISWFVQETDDALSISLNTGSLLLTVLVVLEYLKQISDDSILKFRENSMFYINVGVILFYIGAHPFHVFQKYLYADYKVFIEYYYVYFLGANCSMYLLFIASFVWGKKKS
ncbi:hypothetical protein [Ascidiimonas sp. W6]|uniref:hypothetical protein n=1 Tax=Ascidiimonas meishanensis TaxID=3128903 RepID=UPI0030EDE165